MTTLLKITYGTDIRRLTLKTEPSFAELQTFIKNLYAADIPNVFVIKYLDDEGDKISVTNKQELTEAWEFARNHGAILRLTIESKTPAPSTPAPREKPKEQPQQQQAAAPNLGNLVDEALRMPEVQTILGALNLDPSVIRPTIDNLVNAFIPDASSTAENKESEKEEKVVHPAICDACNQRIIGIRYKCTACPDYDLCESCEPNSQKIHDAAHTFLKIRRPTGPHPFFRGWHGRHGCRRFGKPGEGESEGGECPARGPWGHGFGYHGFGRRGGRRWGGRCGQFSEQQETEGQTQTPGASTGGCPFPFMQRYLSRFIADVTVEDGSQFTPGTPFVKIWKMRNNGPTAWPEPTRLTFVGGDTLSNTESVIVPSVQPNEEVDITVDMVAPSAPGRYVSKFRLCTPEGSRFGHCVWADITVVEAKTEEKKTPEPAASAPVEAAPVEEKPVEIPVTVVVEKKEEPVEKKEDKEEGFSDVIDQFVGMGFLNRELNLQLLKQNNGDVLLTVHQLLSL